MEGAEPDELLDPAAGFHAVLAGEKLIGFRSFGPDGQVPGGTTTTRRSTPAVDSGRR